MHRELTLVEVLCVKEATTTEKKKTRQEQELLQTAVLQKGKQKELELKEKKIQKKGKHNHFLLVPTSSTRTLEVHLEQKMLQLKEEQNWLHLCCLPFLFRSQFLQIGLALLDFF